MVDPLFGNQLVNQLAGLPNATPQHHYTVIFYLVNPLKRKKIKKIFGGRPGFVLWVGLVLKSLIGVNQLHRVLCISAENAI
jgi:hypothetical protein